MFLKLAGSLTKVMAWECHSNGIIPCQCAYMEVLTKGKIRPRSNITPTTKHGPQYHQSRWQPQVLEANELDALLVPRVPGVMVPQVSGCNPHCTSWRSQRWVYPTNCGKRLGENIPANGCAGCHILTCSWFPNFIQRALVDHLRGQITSKFSSISPFRHCSIFITGTT